MTEGKNRRMAQGRASTWLGWALFAPGLLVLVGALTRGEGYFHLGDTPAQIAGGWLGFNGLTLSAFLLALYAGIVKKNRSGRLLLAASIALLAVSTVLSLRPTDTQFPPDAVEFVTSEFTEFEVAFPHAHTRKMAYVQGVEVTAYETKYAESPHLRVEFTPLANPTAQVLDLRNMLEEHARLAGLHLPQITVADDDIGRVGTYSGTKTVASVELRVFGKVVLGTQSMVSCLVVEPLAEFPSTDSALLLGGIRRK